MFQRLEHWLFDHAAGSAPVRQLQVLLRYPYALMHDLGRGDLTLRAMSLVYTTLLSLVPLLALCFSIMKALGYHRSLTPVLLRFLEPMGVRGQELTDNIMRFVDNVRGGLLGSLSLAFLLYTAVSMVQKVEAGFNMVWRVRQARSLGRRIIEYLSVLTLGPALIVTALGLMAALANHRLVRAVESVEPFGTVLAWFGHATPYLLVVGVFTFLYAFVPNAKVQLRAAFVGGAFAGVVWVASGVLFASVVGGSNDTVMIYAGFAAVILALVWLHISWLILLLGTQLAFYVQYPQCLRPGAGIQHVAAGLSERLALSVMFLLGQDFLAPQGARYSLATLAERLYLAQPTLAPILRRLEKAKLVLVTDDGALIPGRDLDRIALTDILDAVRSDHSERAMGLVRSVPAADQVAANAVAAMRGSTGGATLKDLLLRGDGLPHIVRPEQG
jgi:membrane protein